MFIYFLKRALAFTLFSVFAFIANAQQIHFVYIQTESAQPFYVRLYQKIISSSVAGYVILSKLTDGEYEFNIGFPKNEFPEEKFKISMANKDEGFLLKNFGEKGWGLFNLESFEVAMGIGANNPDTVTKSLANDAFSRMLANVVKDSSILQKNIPPKNYQASDKIDSAVATTPPLEKVVIEPTVRLISEENNNGLKLIYVDKDKNDIDTIQVYIPLENINAISDSVGKNIVQKTIIPQVSKEDSASSVNVLPKSEESGTNVTSSPPVFLNQISTIQKEDTEKISKSKIVRKAAADSTMNRAKEPIFHPAFTRPDSTSVKKNQPEDTLKSKILVLPEKNSSSNINSDCKAFANYEDFFKLRKKMATLNSDDQMISAAKKVFKSKCFITDQIKNLSFLFLTDKGRYMFFDMAYAYTSDSGLYYTLQSQLTDPYYINRFKAMIRK
jgi:hypothetical protein